MSNTPHPADIFAGKQLRTKRIILGISQEEIGEAVGITFQQIQKYEKGLNRMGASRIAEFSKVLKVSPGCFFEGGGGDEEATILSMKKKKRVMALVRNFLTMNEKQQLSLLGFISCNQGES